MPSTHAPARGRSWMKSAAPILLACAISLLLLIGLVGGLAGYSTAPAQAQPAQQPPAAPTPIIGEPCGRSTRLAEWAYCLHGQVLGADGAPLVVDENHPVTVTATTEEGRITGQTSVQPGQPFTQPSYGLDISVITPTFLGPVTVTVSNGSVTTTRAILALPDWASHNQRFDLRLPETPPADLQLFGYVYDYTSGTIVAGARVTVERAGFGAASVDTNPLPAFDPSPVFVFDRAALVNSLAITEATLVSVTASYSGMTFSTLTDIAPGVAKQVNLVVGWPCVNDDGLGRAGGKGFGLPRGGGRGFGLPDESCIWGEVSVDGVPSAGVDVYIATADGEVHQGVTGVRDGATTPTYAIIVPNATELIGSSFSVAATLDGYAQVVTQTLADAPTQRVDVRYITVDALDDIGQGRQVRARWAAPYLWLLPNSTGEPLVRVTPVNAANGIISGTQTTLVYTSVHGLPSQNLAEFSQDKLGRLWFWGQGLSIYAPELDPRYQDPAADANLGAWLTLDPNDELAPGLSCCGLTFDSQGGAWVTTNGAGVTYVKPTLDATSALTVTPRQYTWLTDGLAAGAVITVLLDSQENAWLPATGGVSRIALTTSQILSVTAAQLGFMTDTLDSADIKLTQDDNLWVRAAGGSAISRISPNMDVVTIYPGCRPEPIEQADAALAIASRVEYLCVPSSEVTDIFSGANNSIWFVLRTGSKEVGIAHVSGSLTVNTLTSTLGLQSQPFYNVEIDNRGNLWIGTPEILGRVDATTLATKTYSASQLDLFRVDYIDNIDSQGNVWLYDSERLVRIDGSSLDTITSYPGESLWPNGYGDGPSRQFDPAGNLWIHAWDKRVSYIDAKTLALTVFSTEQMGLEGWVGALVIDQVGNVTIRAKCDGRVSRWQPTTGTWRVMTIGQPNSLSESCWLFTAESPYLWYERDVIEHGTYPSSYYWGIVEQAIERPQDLSLELLAPPSAVANREITYTMVVSNVGQQWVRPTLALTLPIGSKFITSSLPITPPNESFFPTAPVVWALDWLTPVTGTAAVTALIVMPADPGATTLVTASVDSPGEGIQFNNIAAWSATLAEPRPNLRVAVVGPPFVADGEAATYTLWVDNTGGDPVPEGSQLFFNGAPIAALPALGGLNTTTNVFSITQSLALPLQSDGYAAVNAAVVAPPGTTESDPSDNQAQTVAAGAPEQLDTLFVVAGNQMALRRSHGASGVLTGLAALARDRQVRGAILDVERSEPVAAAYAAWRAAADPAANTQLANAVAEAIRNEIRNFLTAHPNVRYIVFVGGDDIIPFYRVTDGSNTHWNEKTFAGDLPPGSVRDALSGNHYLTDDYYTDNAAETPNSLYWPRQRQTFVPDRVSSRLVETPAEIQATIAAFLATAAADRTIALTPIILGGDQRLTKDTIDRSCRLVNPVAVPVCTADEPVFANYFAGAPWSSAWTAFHANQLVNGEVTAAKLFSTPTRFDRRLWVSIGCHSGLNVPGTGGQAGELDLIQAFSGKGGIAIAPTAYGYASRTGQPSYSELFMLKLGMRLQACSGQSIGAAFIQAKHDFFAEHETIMDTLDEKALLPLTLYGLPHWQVLSGSPNACPQPPADAAGAPAAVTGVTAITTTVLTVTLDPALLQPINPPLPTGSYYQYNGNSLAQDRRPIQPLHHVPIPPVLADASWPHGVMLLDAGYRDLPDFDPMIEQAWAISALRQEQPGADAMEPPVVLNGWDHDYPHSLGYYARLAGAEDSNAVASLNLVLGACDARTAGGPGSPVRCRVERLFDHLVLGVLYSTSDITTTPILSDIQALMTPGFAFVTFTASEPLQAASAVCDDGQGRYVAATARGGDGVWSATCPFAATRLFVQAANMAGNVTVSGWQTPVAWAPTAFAYLGTVMNNREFPLPDLIVTGVQVDAAGKLAATIQNVGRGWVTDDFWVDLCFMNSDLPQAGPPTGYNDVCKGRAYDYLVWAVAATGTPIPPGGTLTLLQDGADPAESVFERTIRAGTPIYVNVDSTNANTPFGGVREENERSNQPDANNVAGPWQLPVDLKPPAPVAGASAAARPSSLPIRVNPPTLSR